MAIYSFSPFGYEGNLINVEVDLRHGIPAIDIVGLADSCVKESRERVKSAIQNSLLEFPSERVLISLSPADLKKEIPLDLPIAIELLRSQYGLELGDDVFVMGELELSGSVRNVKGTHAGLQTALLHGIKFAILPHQKKREDIPSGMFIKYVRNLTEAYYALCDLANGDYSDFTDYSLKSESDDGNIIKFNDVSDEESIDKITDHNKLKFAMAVAVAGRHNLLVYGEPGCGKTMTLQKMPQLMPKLLATEKDTVNRIYSIAGYDYYGGLNSFRPFRMPHQTASIESICGGGPNCRPGEVSLAHNGILFLDEAAEFRSSVLMMLRVPLENGTITLSRAGRTTVYPARFQLAMAMNPCPCGNYGSKTRICLCSAKSIEQYWKKVSNPLLDCMEIKINGSKEEDKYLTYSLEELRRMIKRAWETQLARQNKLNHDLAGDEIEKYIILDKHAKEHFDTYSLNHDLSPIGKKNLLKLARTIQDMHSDDKEVSDVSLCTAMNLMGSIPVKF